MLPKNNSLSYQDETFYARIKVQSENKIYKANKNEDLISNLATLGVNVGELFSAKCR